MGNAIELTDANFEAEVLQSDKPVLVDFWAHWCGPCRMIAPMIDQLSVENGGNLKVGKFNIDTGTDTPSAYQVSNIPTVMLFKNGEVVDRFVGTTAKSVLQGAIEQALA